MRMWGARGCVRGNQQRCPDEGSVQRPHGRGPEPGFGTVYSFGMTGGIKDYKNVNLGTWRAATSGEINTGQLPAGASLRQVITAGGDRTQEVLTAESVAEVVTTTGSPTVTTNNDGSKTYTFGAGSPAMQVLPRTGNVIHENEEYNSAFTVNYKVSSFTYAAKKAGTVCIYSNGAWTPVEGGGSNVWYSGVNYSKSTLTVTGVDTGDGSAALTFTPKAPSQGGGTVRVMPSVPERTTTQKYGYYLHIPASAEEVSKVFLVQQDSAATQNFAFDIDEDVAVK